jgi:hypothetical protein
LVRYLEKNDSYYRIWEEAIKFLLFVIILPLLREMILFSRITVQSYGTDEELKRNVKSSNACAHDPSFVSCMLFPFSWRKMDG